MKKIITLLITSLLSISTALAASILDTSFNIGSGANGLVEQVLPLSNGKILICGNFTSFNGKNRAYVARLNSDGSVDESFQANPGYWVRNMAVQPDGKIVIGGFFTTVSGTPRNLIARLNENGSLDPSFNPGTGARDLIGAGIDGNVDPFVFWVAVQPDGKILATGNFRNYNGASSVGIVRINPDGSRDTSFNVGNGLDSWGRHIQILPNGQILLSGWFTQYNGRGFNRVARINSDGSPDTSFQPYFGDKTAIYSTASVANGKYIVVGHSLNDQGLFHQEMARLNPNGSFDTGFIGVTNEKTESVVVQPDGNIIIGGYFTYANRSPRRMVARMFPDGTLDPNFQANIDNFVWTVALQNDGKLLISGGFTTVDGVSYRGVARLLTGSSGGNPPPPVDTAPSLTATAVASSQINLSWSDSSGSRSGYNVERRTGSSGFTQVATVSASARSYSDSGLAATTGYTYRIKANNNTGTSIYSNEAGATTLGVPGSSNNSAQFAGSDTSTMGSWKGVYGGEGYQIIGNATSLPSYVQATPSGASEWIWQWSTQDADALQRASGTDRLAACWYSAGGFSVSFNFTDGRTHTLAAYFHDWDAAGRNQTVRIVDADTGATLDTQTVANFSNGVYLKWVLGGKVRMTVTPNTGNAVVSGLFFGPAGTTQPPPAGQVATPAISPNGGTFTSAQTVTITTSTSGAEIRYTADGSEPSASSALYQGPVTVTMSGVLKARAFKSGMTASPTAAATFTINSGGGGGTSGDITFVGSDSNTKGNWRGVYGSEGYNILQRAVSYPSYVQVSASGKQDWTWNSTTTDVRGLQTPDGSSRIGSCWYTGSSMDINFNFTDSNVHRVALYFCDWDNAGRSQTVEVIDGNSGATGYSTTLSGFGGGRYLIFDLKGSVKVRVTKGSGPNAVVNGVFFK
ncbi:MAG: chitobiase/beta-hexosaminidase C-terminal domain-containing protein [Verrucomicrobiales bacterium]